MKSKSIFRNVIMISGTGRKSGKTYLACSLIRKYSKYHEVVAIKISSHFHEFNQENSLIYDDSSVLIFREKDASLPKDSSRMLAAGANEVYYIQAPAGGLDIPFGNLMTIIGSKRPVIIESGTLRNMIIPGLFLRIYREGSILNKITEADDEDSPAIKIVFDGHTFHPDPDRIIFTDEGWKYNPV